ncbi:hypothetical protein F4678DRAFT_209606 [Xylaria arbuscula]|nr:hypothetical protein F4678DRAFT_209606 [Xylaria arbuscula]
MVVTIATRVALSIFATFFVICAANLPPGVAGPRWPSFFEAPDFHLNIAKRDIEQILKPKDDSPGPRWPTIFEAPDFHLSIAKNDIEGVFKGDENAPGPRWPTIFEAPEFHLAIAANDIANVGRGIGRGVEAWVAQALKDIESDPIGTIIRAARDVTNTVAFVFPGLIWGPILNLLGFGLGGIGLGTAAAAIHSAIGTASAYSPFSYLQSAGAGGYGAAVMDAFVRGGILVKELLRL